jgi:transposase
MKRRSSADRDGDELSVFAKVVELTSFTPPSRFVATTSAIKEALRTLWTYRQPAAVRRFFTRWHGWAITNGVAEGLNSKIVSIKLKAGGFGNPANFTTAIYFHCGGLDLYPR